MAARRQAQADGAEDMQDLYVPATTAGEPSAAESRRGKPSIAADGTIGGFAWKPMVFGFSALVAVAIIIALIAVVGKDEKELDDRPGMAPAEPPSQQEREAVARGITNDDRSEMVRSVMAMLASNASIKSFMREFSELPHLAGSARNLQLAEITAEKLRAFGFDEVRVDIVPVLLEDLQSRQVLVHEAGTGRTRYTCLLEEPNIVNQTDYAAALKPSNGYSGNGTVTAPVVWVNYGQLADFEAIERLSPGVLKGKIAVARYGKIFRGNKVQLAQKFGAAGIIIVNDPFLVGDRNGQRRVFPDGPWATNLTVQRGSVYTGEGDPLTPFWPSEAGGPALSVAAGQVYDNAEMIGNALPSIPVQPMGYGDAAEVLRGLGGSIGFPASDAAWNDTGFLPILMNGAGPSAYNVTLTVKRALVTRNLANVHGVIRGSLEPDRIIAIGSHRDAWTYGAIDPISGASVILELARVLGRLHRDYSWTPRRTIQVSSWGGEEWGLLGSVEYVENQVELLRQRAVVYINVDTAVTGIERLNIEGSPSLGPVTRIAAAAVRVGTAANAPTLAELWGANHEITAPGSGSDHTPWIQLAGAPVLVPELDSTSGMYDAVYHSNYDCLEWVEKFGDPEFQGHLAMTRFIGHVTVQMADLNLVPLSATAYAAKVDSWVKRYTDNPANSFADWRFMQAKVADFKAAAASLQQQIDALNASLVRDYPDIAKLQAAGVTGFKIRSLNDVVVGLERVFLGGHAETESYFFKHVLYTPSAINSYGSTVMPLIADHLASGNATQANFDIGRIAQFIGRAARFVNTSVWWA